MNDILLEVLFFEIQGIKLSLKLIIDRRLIEIFSLKLVEVSNLIVSKIRLELESLIRLFVSL